MSATLMKQEALLLQLQTFQFFQHNNLVLHLNVKHSLPRFSDFYQFPSIAIC